MRSGHNKSRNRSRHRSSNSGGGGSSGGGGGNPLSRVYESNGPDVKVRGTAQTVADKYMQLGRDAHVAGDIVMAESYYQFAEHYSRIVTAAQAYNQQMQPQQNRRPDDDLDEDGDEDGGDDTASVQMRNAPQPASDQAAGNGEPREGDDRRDYRDSRDYRDNRGNRDNRDQGGQSASRDSRDNRDQGGQPYNRDQGGQSHNRDRNRPRYPDRRDQPQSANGEPRPHQPQPRAEEPPREAAPAPPPPRVEEIHDSGQWEAPSFLRRPAALPVAEPATAAPANAAAEAPAPDKKPKRAYTRREKPVEAESPAPVGDPE